jgi:hypothetical protein
MLNVHDELGVTYPRHLRDVVEKIVRDALTSPIPEMPAAALDMHTGLRFNTDIKVGPNWAAVRKIEDVRKLEAEGIDPWCEAENPWMKKTGGKQ